MKPRIWVIISPRLRSNDLLRSPASYLIRITADQGVNCQGLDKCRADDHSGLNLTRSLRLTAHRLHGGANRTAQAEARADRGNTDRQRQKNPMMFWDPLIPPILNDALHRELT